MLSAAYKQYILNLPRADTFSGPKGFRLREVQLYAFLLHAHNFLRHKPVRTFETALLLVESAGGAGVWRFIVILNF